MADTDIQLDTVGLATELTIAWLSNSNNRVSADDVPAFLSQMHAAVSSLASGTTATGEEAATYEGAVSVRRSLASVDHIISMIDGKPYKSLKRHLSGHGLTPDQYRQRYNLKADYPMVSATYSQNRRDLAKKIGLGRKPKAAAAGDQSSATKAVNPKSRSQSKQAYLAPNLPDNASHIRRRAPAPGGRGAGSRTCPDPAPAAGRASA